MTAVIYSRYSSDNQREESIEGQIRECTAYAEKNGLTVVKHYIEMKIANLIQFESLNTQEMGRNNGLLVHSMMPEAFIF